MFRREVIVLFGIALCGSATPARAELPSLYTDKASAKAGESEIEALLPTRLRSLQQGKLMFDFGAIDYRLANQGFRASLPVMWAATTAILGYGGEHRLEMGWRAGGGTLKLAFTAHGGDGGYRVEFARRF